MRFVDTNVLLYAISTPGEDDLKRNRALELLKDGDLAVSVQVLGEFYNQATRRSRQGAITHDQALTFLESISSFPIQPLTLNVFRSAADICHRFGLSYWDSAILAAAHIAGCDAVYSEDMSSEQDYGGLRVINPFEDQ